MEIAKEAFLLSKSGFCDCVFGIYTLVADYLLLRNNERSSMCIFFGSRKNVERISVRDSHSQDNVRYQVRSRLFECFAFGLFFLLSHIIFNRFLLQSAFIQLVEWTGEDVNSTSVFILDYILRGMFLILWIFPLLCLSKFLNFNWYQDIANSVLLQNGQKKFEDIKMSDFYADQIKSLVLQMVFCVQGFIVSVPAFCSWSIIPWYVEKVWCIFHCALLSSLYAFEYKWVYSGWPLHRRLFNIATKWPYYFGFGFILALINYVSSSFILSLIVFATFFPVYVISSSVTQERQYPAFRYPFHVFKFADFLSDFIIWVILR